MIVDCHCHAGKGDRLTDPFNTDAPIGPYLHRARAAGIDKTIVFSPARTDYQQANRDLARLIARFPERLIGFAFVHPLDDAGRIGSMVEEAVRYGFRGLKVHGHEGTPTRELCDTARRFRLPVLVDVFGKPEIVEMFAPQYPDVNFIIPHMGSFADDWRAQQRVVDQLVRYPNVYADSAGVRRFDYLVDAVRRAGPRKLIFGSDGPWLHPGVEIEKIRLLKLQPGAEKLVLGGNILRLISRPQ